MTKVSLRTGTKETPDLPQWHSPEITVTEPTEATASYQTTLLRSGLRAGEYLPICSTNTEGMIMLRNIFCFSLQACLSFSATKVTQKPRSKTGCRFYLCLYSNKSTPTQKMTPSPPKSYDPFCNSNQQKTGLPLGKHKIIHFSTSNNLQNQLYSILTPWWGIVFFLCRFIYLPFEFFKHSHQHHSNEALCYTSHSLKVWDSPLF